MRPKPWRGRLPSLGCAREPESPWRSSGRQTAFSRISTARRFIPSPLTSKTPPAIPCMLVMSASIKQRMAAPTGSGSGILTATPMLSRALGTLRRWRQRARQLHAVFCLCCRYIHIITISPIFSAPLSRKVCPHRISALRICLCSRKGKATCQGASQLFGTPGTRTPFHPNSIQ